MGSTGGMWTAVLAYLINYCLISGHSNGAPPSSCNTMVPNLSQVEGHGAFPQIWRNDPPYELRTFDHLGRPILEYTSGTPKAIRVEIRGPKFRGFMLQARTLYGRGRRVGKFVHPLPTGTQLLKCDNKNKQTAVTHRNSRIKRNPYFFWVPPRFRVGPIVFLATIVKSRTKYWTMITSPHMYPRSNDLRVDTKKCGVGFGCLKASSEHGCSRSLKYCDYTLRWKCNSHTVIMEVYGKKTKHQGHTEGNFVGLGWENEVVICTIGSQKSSVDANYNISVSNYLLSQTLNELYYYKRNEPLPLKMAADSDGFLCRFERRISPNLKHATFIYGNFKRDGTIGKMHRVSLDQEYEPFRLCRHPDISIILPSDSAIVSALSNVALCVCYVIFACQFYLLSL